MRRGVRDAECLAFVGVEVRKPKLTEFNHIVGTQQHRSHHLQAEGLQS
jgi:hypothetical protein